MALRQIDLKIDDSPLPTEVEQWLARGRARIEQFWDQFKQKPLAQYIECDFDYVARALRACTEQNLVDGRLFCEWGCGFGIVAGIASLMGLDAVGIEAEEFLCQEARKLFAAGGVSGEIWHGNFLPRGARELAEDEDPLVSLTHTLPSAYAEHDVLLSDFALIFIYPWPGEEHFMRAVFDRFARPGALMLQFRGPYHVELYRKTAGGPQSSHR